MAKVDLFPGTLFRASQFLSEELPIRLAHRVQELGNLPDGLNDMPSIKKVQDWYSQSFEVYDPSDLPREPPANWMLGHYHPSKTKSRIRGTRPASATDEAKRARLETLGSNYAES